MSDISSINSDGSVDWSAVIAKINSNLGENSTDGVSGSVALSGENLVITVTGDDGTVNKKEVALPVVTSDMSVEEAQAALADFMTEVADTCEAMADDLAATAAQVESETGASASSTGTAVQKLLFDIYDLIKLLREVAQEQRDNAREIRETELQTQLKAIQNQSDEQMRAAVLGMVVGTVLCAVQVTIAAVGAGKSISDMKAADNCAASQEINSAENNLKTMKLDSEKSLNDRINELGGKLPQGTTMDSLNTEIGTKMTAAKNTQEVVQAQTVLTEKQTAVATAQAEVNTVQAEVNTLQTEVNTVQAEVTQLQEQVQNLEGLSVLPGNSAEIEENLGAARTQLSAKQTELSTKQTELSTKQSELTTKQANLATKQAECDTAQTTYNKTLAKAYDGVADEYDQACSPLVDEAKAAEKGYVDKFSIRHPIDNYRNGKTMLEAQNNLGDAYAKADYVRAKIIQAKTGLGCGPTDEQIGVLETSIAAKTNALSSDRGYKASMNNMTGQLLTTVPNMLTGTFQGVTQLASASADTQATLEQAIQKESEADREMTQDLITQEKNVLDDAKSLLQAIIQAENQSIEQIISA